MDNLFCYIELRRDGVVLVRVPPANPQLADTVPDAVFSFRRGDPQYSYWRARYELESGGITEATVTSAGVSTV